MEQHKLSVEIRESFGKGPARRARQAGRIPGIIYGHGEANVAVTVDPAIVERTLLREGGKNQVFDLEGANLKGKKALIKEYQVDPVSRKLLHVDLMEVRATDTVEVTVKINYVGKAKGVKDDGGVMNIIQRDIEVECRPDQIPEHIDIDVTELRMNHSIHLSEVTMPEGVSALNQTDVTLVTIVPPSKEEDTTASLESNAEPEVITEKKKDPSDGGDKGDKKG